MTKKNFSLLEAMELAITMEEEGVAFYTLAAGKAAASEVKSLLNSLKEKEYNHINTFRRIYTKLSERQGMADAALYLTDPEIEAYFRAFVDSAVFPTRGAAARVIAGLDSAEEVLLLGMRIEKDSILYYQELKQRAPFPGAAEALDQVIGEEKSHLRDIHKLYKALVRGRN